MKKLIFPLLFFFLFLAPLVCADEPVYLFAHTNRTIAVTASGVFYNITFDENVSFKTGITHNYNDTTNDTFTITKEGIYDITFHMTFEDDAASPNGHIIIRATKNGVELEGSLLEEDSSKQYADFTIGNGGIFEFEKGDEIRFQFASDDTTLSLDSHVTYGDHKDTAVIKIRRMASSYIQVQDIYFYLLSGLVIVCLVWFGRRTEDVTFPIIGGFFTCVLGLAIFRIGFPYFTNQYILNVFSVTLFGWGFYLIIHNSYNKIRETFKK